MKITTAQATTFKVDGITVITHQLMKYLLIVLIAMYGVATYIDHTLVIDNCKPQDCKY